MSENSAVSAKVRAMYGNCLDDADFDNLLSCTGISGICTYLKEQTSYADVLRDVTDNNIHRGNLELKILNKLESEYNRIYKFVDKHQQSILDYWFRRREVNYLKHNIRNLYNRESELAHMPDPEEFSAFFQNHTAIDTELCRNAESMNDFVKAVGNTIYEKFLNQAAVVNADYFSIAMGLDALYYELYWRDCMKLAAKEKTAMECLVGTEIDMLNLIWIYRGKKYFKFSDEKLYTHLIPVHYRLNESLIKQMVSAKKVEEMIAVAEKTRYKSLFKNLLEGFYVDENFRRDMHYLSKKIFRNSPNTVAGLVAYLDIKEIEILDVVRVIEGIRYGLNKDTLKKHIRL